MAGFFAVTFRGLEKIAANEIVQVTGATIKRHVYRQVHFDLQTNFESLLQLRTIDDLFVSVEHWQPVTRQRSSLELIAENSSKLVLREAMAVIGKVRQLPVPLIFSVTANFVGKRNYTSAEIKQRVADAITDAQQWQYTENDSEADLNIRLFIEADTAEVGVRLAKRPLHNRDYPPTDYSGSLKPPVAAAMVLLAEPLAGQLLLDPCCGSGTILMEALYLGVQIAGGDISSRAVHWSLNRDLTVRQWDARSLPLNESSVDRIVSNLPWDDQSDIKTDRTTFYDDICREMERVLAPEGKIVLLTTMAEDVQFTSLKQEMSSEISLFGKRPVLLKFG